jgi:glutamate-1-semialdehyde aminotransferase
MNERVWQERNRTSRELWERSCRVIVGGGQAHKRPVDLMKLGGPAFIARARGAKFWDVDGNEYVDYLLGYGPIVLGHSDPDVNEAIRRQIEEGTVYSVEGPKEIELAEKLIELIPCAEMVMYYVGGSGATSGALRVARAHTRREVIIRCGYHGWHDWCVPDNPGVPLYNRTLIQEVPYNDLPALQKKLEAFVGKVAGVMIEAIQWGGPSEGYFEGVRALCDEHGAVFILDEVKTGFRFDLGGAQRSFGIDCDIATFGKAMCNGYPGSVLVGRREFMEGRTDTHMAATFHGDLLSVVAALTVIRIMEERDGIGHFQRLGRKLIEGLNRIFTEAEAPLKVIGYPPMPWPVVTGQDDPNPCPEAFKGQAMNHFCAALQRRGIYATGHPWFLSLAHTDGDIDRTLAIAGQAVKEFMDIMAAATA